MIELTDNINWNNFLAELKPESWYKRREGEGNVDWIKRVAIKDLVHQFAYEAVIINIKIIKF